MSWVFISLYLLDTIFHRARFNGLISKKEDDAGDLISRAEFIYNHIPQNVIPKALLPKIKNGKMSKSPPILEFPEIDSKLQGFPMGSDQLRQFTLSGILGDEVAFWEGADKFYSASKPTLDGGGRMTLISSRSPGFFKKIVFDQLDAQDLNFPETPPAEVKRPIEGIEIWKNPKNDFLVFDCHYSANPAKRPKEWVDAVRKSMPVRDFLMEYEKSWQTYEGLPVYGDFNKFSHVSQFALTPHLGVPLLIGWDFGLTPSAVVGQLCDGQLRILREYVGQNSGIIKFAQNVWSDLRLKYTAWTRAEDAIFSFIDPAGFQRSQVDEKTCAQGLRKEGFTRLEPGPVDFEARRSAVEYFLTRQTKVGSALLLDPKSCQTLIEGFSGGYRYADKERERESAKVRPLKDRYSHPHDALQYLCAGALGKQKQFNITMHAPTYGFQKHTSEKETRK